jgi:hypothetical protein
MGFIDCLVIYGGLFACGWIGRLQFSGALFGLCFLAIIGAVALSQRIYFKSIEEGEAGSQSDIAP